MASFDSLPLDLKSVIVEHINRPTELRNLCLVSKQLHEIAVQFLYKTISLSVGSARDTVLSAFLNPRNKGLQHIRCVRLFLADLPEKKGTPQTSKADFTARMLIEFLPENILEDFSISWRSPSKENVLLLHKKQKQLRSLQVSKLNGSLYPELQDGTLLSESLCTRVSRLVITPTDRDTLETAGYLMKQISGTLKELVLYPKFQAMNGSFSPSMYDDLRLHELNDSAIAPGLIISTIFAHLMPFNSCQPLQYLTSLDLTRVNLRHCLETWCKVVKFEQIETLRIKSCHGADTLLGHMSSKAALLPKRLRTLEFRHSDNPESEALLALDGFLCLVFGIRELIIDFYNAAALPAATSIITQAKTVALLSLHASSQSDIGMTLPGQDASGDELVYTNEDFHKICQACRLLEQLSCAWPETDFLQKPTADWLDFESSCTAHLVQLVTLHITTWPNAKYHEPRLPRACYKLLLQGVAQRIFRLTSEGPDEQSIGGDDDDSEDPWAGVQDDLFTTRDRLRLVAFGYSDKIEARKDSSNQVIYIRSSALDAEGRSKVHAAPVGWCLRKYLEPCSEVLDLWTNRQSRLPVQENSRKLMLGDDMRWTDV